MNNKETNNINKKVEEIYSELEKNIEIATLRELNEFNKEISPNIGKRRDDYYNRGNHYSI